MPVVHLSSEFFRNILKVLLRFKRRRLRLWDWWEARWVRFVLGLRICCRATSQILRIWTPVPFWHLDRDQARERLLLAGPVECRELAADGNCRCRNGVLRSRGRPGAQVRLHRLNVIVVATFMVFARGPSSTAISRMLLAGSRGQTLNSLTLTSGVLAIPSIVRIPAIAVIRPTSYFTRRVLSASDRIPWRGCSQPTPLGRGIAVHRADNIT